MTVDLLRQRAIPSEYHLFLFTGIIAVAAVGYTVYTPGPIGPDLLVVLVPLGVSLGLGLFTVRLRERQLEAAQVHRIVKWGWIGTVASAAIAGWMIALHYINSVPVGGVVDQALIIISLGSGVGVFVGAVHTQTDRHTSPTDHAERRTEPVPDRDRVLAETSWANRPGSDPILDAIVETLADAEGVDPLELEPIQNHINPDLFAQLPLDEDAEWQLLFYTDGYAIRASSVGTVTVYEREL